MFLKVFLLCAFSVYPFDGDVTSEVHSLWIDVVGSFFCLSFRLLWTPMRFVGALKKSGSFTHSNQS